MRAPLLILCLVASPWGVSAGGCDYPPLREGAHVTHPTESGPLSGKLGELVPSFQKLGGPQEREGGGFDEKAWTAEQRQARAKAMADLTAFYETPAGKAAIDKLLADQLQQWKKDGALPPGMTPDDWNPIKNQVTDMPKFFAVLGGNKQLLDTVMGNAQNTASMAAVTLGVTGHPTILERYLRTNALYSCLYVSARHHGLAGKMLKPEY